MDCKHDVNFLMGTSDGIVCRKCGKVFPSLAALHADLEADRAGKPAAAEVPQEKPKRVKKKND